MQAACTEHDELGGPSELPNSSSIYPTEVYYDERPPLCRARFPTWKGGHARWRRRASVSRQSALPSWGSPFISGLMGNGTNRFQLCPPAPCTAPFVQGRMAWVPILTFSSKTHSSSHARGLTTRSPTSKARVISRTSLSLVATHIISPLSMYFGVIYSTGYHYISSKPFENPLDSLPPTKNTNTWLRTASSNRSEIVSLICKISNGFASRRKAWLLLPTDSLISGTPGSKHYFESPTRREEPASVSKA